MQGDPVVLGCRDGTGSEAYVGDHESLVGSNLLADLLQQQHFALINSGRSTPLSVGNV
jgi:hypothetical protein